MEGSAIPINSYKCSPILHVIGGTHFNYLFFCHLIWIFRLCRDYAALNSEVQCGQRVALMGIVEAQYGHSFVVGAAAGASSLRLSWLMPRTRRKLIIVFTNTP